MVFIVIVEKNDIVPNGGQSRNIIVTFEKKGLRDSATRFLSPNGIFLTDEKSAQNKTNVRK